jgi:hypothetical protein
MNANLAGDPAPTNPATALDDLLAVFEAAGLAPDMADVIARGFLSRHRAEVLAEAVEAARAEYLTDGTGTDEDNAYNSGVTDAIAAIGALTEAGESRG